MAVILNTASNPGTAVWSNQWLVAATGIATLVPPSSAPGINSVAVTVGPGLEGLPVILSWMSQASAFGSVAGGRLYGSITGSVLTISVWTYNTFGINLKVSYTVLRAA